MKILNRFWNDEAGVIISSELILVVTLLVIGLIAGLGALRDSVTQELGDVAAAIGFIQQDYTFVGTSNANAASTNGSAFNDTADDGDIVDPAGAGGGNGVVVTLPAVAPGPEA